MNLKKHSAADFATAMSELLPPGNAWDWPAGGTGFQLLTGLGQELARTDNAIPGVLAAAIDAHRPAITGWRLENYQEIAEKALVSVGQDQSLVKVRHRISPFRVGSRAGDRCWSARSRYILLVQYMAPANIDAVITKLRMFAQSHVFLFPVQIRSFYAQDRYGR